MNLKSIRKYVLPFLLMAVIGFMVVAACSGTGDATDAPESAGVSGDIDAIAAARGLTPADVEAAVKTFTPTGQHDEYIMFASGGHSGQMLVIGMPSMRLLKVIGVFTPEPWQGWG
ncbi:MAG: hypothetical protein KAS38_06275, partial [Anaerolineales bacterium]|nr:hypothetical protein [Anaerolineales bacterium]